jgi:hypothetical protein
MDFALLAFSWESMGGLSGPSCGGGQLVAGRGVGQ